MTESGLRMCRKCKKPITISTWGMCGACYNKEMSESLAEDLREESRDRPSKEDMHEIISEQRGNKEFWLKAKEE